MNTQGINLELLSELETPEYHDYFVASQLNKGFSFQMRALRAKQDLTQKGLAELAGTKQSVISRIETNGVTNLSVKSLLKLASAFNLGLVLRFVSLEHLLDWTNPISLEELAPKKSSDVINSLRKPAKNESVERKPAPQTISAKIFQSPIIEGFERLPKPKQSELNSNVFSASKADTDELSRYRESTAELRQSGYKNVAMGK